MNTIDNPRRWTVLIPTEGEPEVVAVGLSDFLLAAQLLQMGVRA